MHEEVDWDLDFRLDPNQGWRLDEAVRVCAQLEDAGIYLEYVEQPIRTDSPKSLVCLRQRTNQPIGINEDTYVPHNLQQSATEGAVDVAVLDLTALGGIAGSDRQQVSRRKRTFPSLITAHSTSGSGLQQSSTQSAAFPAFRCQSTQRTMPGRTMFSLTPSKSKMEQ